MKKGKDFSSQYITIKIDNNEYRQQLSEMIKQVSQLQIISESSDEIIIVSQHKKQLIKDIFPKIRTIESELTIFERNKKKLIKAIKKLLMLSVKAERHLDIINISGVLIKRD